mmetsp:Transcript_58224/g.155571  ORF Transcript_58224/g.155571 Transcript_58224/m.155571 type:complete len:306 (+) Transcript_58224:1039-1956(+)
MGWAVSTDHLHRQLTFRKRAVRARTFSRTWSRSLWHLPAAVVAANWHMPRKQEHRALQEVMAVAPASRPKTCRACRTRFLPAVGQRRLKQRQRQALLYLCRHGAWEQLRQGIVHPCLLRLPGPRKTVFPLRAAPRRDGLPLWMSAPRHQSKTYWRRLDRHRAAPGCACLACPPSAPHPVRWRRLVAAPQVLETGSAEGPWTLRTWRQRVSLVKTLGRACSPLCFRTWGRAQTEGDPRRGAPATRQGVFLLRSIEMKPGLQRTWGLSKVRAAPQRPRLPPSSPCGQMILDLTCQKWKAQSLRRPWT